MEMILHHQNIMLAVREEMGWPSFRPANDCISWASGQETCFEVGNELARVAQMAGRDVIYTGWASSRAKDPTSFAIAYREMLTIDIIDRLVPFAASDRSPIILVSTSADEFFAIDRRGSLVRVQGKPKGIGKGKTVGDEAHQGRRQHDGRRAARQQPLRPARCGLDRTGNAVRSRRPVRLTGGRAGLDGRGPPPFFPLLPAACRRRLPMRIDIKSEPRNRSWIIFDIESAVIDEAGRRRYQQMERYVPRHDGDDQPGRRGYKRADDPLKTPRWIFQSITTACAMVLTEHPDGNADVSRFVTMSAPDHTEKEIVEGLPQVLADAPADSDLVSWAGSFHDLPMLVCAAMRYGLTLPNNWKWLVFGGDGRQRHVDFARVATANMKMKPIHESELLAAFDIPSKLSAPAFAVARLIESGQWDMVQEQCEGDVIATALLLCRWRKLHDPRVDADVAEDRILRRVCELRAGRGYIAELEARRAARFTAQYDKAANDAARLAPWLEQDAA